MVPWNWQKKKSKSPHLQPESISFEFGWRYQWISLLGEESDGPDSAKKNTHAMEVKHGSEHFWKPCSSTSCENRKLYALWEESFLLPSKYADVVRQHSGEFGHATRAQHRRLLECRQWKTTIWILVWISKMYSSEETFTRRTVWAGARLTKVQTTSRPDDIWPEVRSNMSKQSPREAGQQWDTENPKVDAARRITGIYYGASDDQRKKKIRNACGIRHAVWNTEELPKIHRTIPREKAVRDRVQKPSWRTPCTEE